MTYTFIIKSTDKISGSNNNGIYNFNATILPIDIKYWRMNYTFYSNVSFYKDTISAGNVITYSATNGYIVTDLFSPLSNQSNNNQSKILGTWIKQMNATNITAHPYLTYLYSAMENTSTPLTIIRPTNNQIRISVYNLFDNNFVVDTDSTGTKLTDMSDWILNINLEPILEVDSE